MGTRYTTQTVSGYNVSPPPDDGSTGANNLVTWAGQKQKLADPILTLAQNINTNLVNALDFSSRVVNAADTATAADHMKTIEANTASITLKLPSAVVVGAGFQVSYYNNTAGNITIALNAGTDTLNGTVNGTYTLGAGLVVVFKSNTAANGFFTLASSVGASGTALPIGAGGTGQITADAAAIALHQAPSTTTWKSLLGSSAGSGSSGAVRATGVTLTNGYSYPIYISIVVSSVPSNNNITVQGVIVASFSTSSGVSPFTVGPVKIAPGATYSVNTLSGGAPSAWLEES